jgi:ribosomal-protein-alanine N-acetyltransferase
MRDQPVLLSYPDPPLTDAAVLLRRWEEGDIGCVEEASSDPRIPQGTTVPAIFTPAEGLAWIERQWGRADNGEGLSLAIAEARTGEAVGLVVLLLRRQPGTVEIGYWLIPRARGRRLASRAVALVAGWALTDAGIERVEALVEPDNIASRRVLEGVGFRQEGHLRSYLVIGRRRADALIYSLLPSDLA